MINLTQIRSSLESLVIEHVCGGTDGVIYKARSRVTGGIVATKVSKPGKFAFLLHEIEILKEIRHKHIVVMVSHRINSQFDGIQMELEVEWMHDSLHNHFNDFDCDDPDPTRNDFSNYRLNVRQLSCLRRHIGGALAYLHGTPKILHGDVKTDNIMTNLRLTVFKLCDFGNSIRMPDGKGHKSQYNGSFDYMPPECMPHVHNACAITFAADIYTFGSTLYKCIAGTHFNDEYLALDEHEMLDDEDRTVIYPKVIELINMCLDDDPTNRPSASEVVAHSFKK